MAASYLDMLTKPAPKKSRREELLALALQILALSMEGDAPDGAFSEKDGTGPEIYVAPRYSPAP